MASSYAKRLSTNERFIIHEDADYLRSKVIHCVGLENILEVFLGTKVLEDLRLLEDCKPASVSNWSFDENCLFCCLRREKVKEHVVALNKQIVESGGKPLLGKDLSNISRLEWQSEEFLNAVLHRKEYTPRIPDPHIPVVACDILQQMMNQLAMYYTSRNNHSQDSIQNNGNKDQSHLKTSSSPNTSSTTVDTAAAAAASATILMADQDAPLDLSIKRVKAENFEQDGVLDLSTKKIVNKGQTSFKHSHVSTATHLIKRDSVDPSLVQVKDLQSTSNLEQFMSKLCLHHQRQIVDALGFLQTEVKTVTSSNFQAPTPTISENQTTTSCSRVSFEARSEIQCSKKTCSVDAAVSITRPQESSIVRTNKKENVEILNANAPAMVEKPVDLCKMGVLSSSCGTGVECRNVSTSKFHSVFIMENTTSDHLRAKKLRQSIQHVGTDIVKKYPCLAERRLTCTAESDHAELSSKSIQRCSLAQNQDAVVKPATIQRTSNVVFPISSRTARKSRKTSCSRLRNGSSWRTIIEPDSHCDLVYIRKSITECQPPSHNRLHLRKNARKSTRGHKYIEEYLELKTVRTLAHKSVSDASGNCPAHMPDVTTSVTPRQFLSRPDSVPLVDAPFAGDCMKNVVLKLSDRLAENEVPGDVVKETNQGLMVETSQTGKIDSNDRISNLLACKQGKCTNQQDLIIEADGCASNTVLQENNKDIVRFKEKLECVVQKEGNDSQTEPIMKDVIYGLESKVDCQNEPLEPSLSSVSPNMAEDDSANGFSVEPTNDLKNQNLSDKITPDAQEQSEAMEKNTMDKSIQEQVLHNEFNLNPVNDFKLPKKDQEDSGVSGQMEMSTVQPLEKCEENGVVPDTWKDLDTKIVLAKQVVPSDRCLRSRGSKGSNDETKDSECGAAELDTKMTQANDENLKAPCLTQPLKSQRLNLPEANEHPEGEHNMKTSDILETAQRHSGAKLSNCLVVDQIVQTKCKEKATAVEKDEPHLTLNSVELPSLMSPGVVQEMMTVTSTTESEKTHTSSEKMLLRNRNGHTELAVSGENQSPVKKSPPNFENILLRSKSNIEQPFNSESSSSSLGSHLENQGQTPLRGVNYTSEQETDGDLCISPKRNTSESPMRMPLRSRTSSKIKEAVTTNFSEQSVSLHSSTTCRKAEDDGHMPLRSGTSSAAEQPISSKSVIGDTLDSPGRVSLRRGNMFITEKPCGSTTPPNRNGRPQRQQRVIKTVLNSSSLEVEPSPMNSRLKIQSPRNTDTQIKDSFYLSDESVDIANLLKTEPILSSPKFLQALRGEEHQQLISSLNTKFDKMHKGWVQMDKECQPAPKPKNKADRLKEIWKSKRRIRKTRPLEQQKFSPVQMLFMKPFDLPSICRWFLQSTETKSLVIVKKVNTRLPSETQLCFHSSAAGTGSSHGIFPSLQAERLKKHLKKFPIASPVKNNPKNQRLLSKALGRDISVVSSKEKHEPTSATRICTKAQSLIGVTQTQASEGPGTVTGSSKNPASVRILRKYSNIREKLQVQQSKKCKEKALKVTHLKTSVIPKNPAKQKLQTHKGSKSAVVQSIKSFSKKAKANSAVKERGLKKNLCYKDVISPKRLQALTKVAKANPEHASTNIQSKKEVLIKTVTEKAQQTKTSGGKVDIKKSVYNKGPNSLELQSLDIDMKPLSLEDQVLTRSQRKMDTTPSQTWSPKSSTKRGLDPLVTPTKRTRTSKQ